MPLDDASRRDWVLAFARGDATAVDRIVAELGPAAYGELKDVAASVGGALWEQILVGVGQTRASIQTRSDRQLADLVLGPLQQVRKIPRAEHRAIVRSMGPMVRGWRHMPGLWRGGNESLWLFGYVLPYGVLGLREQDLLDEDQFVRDWEEATDVGRPR